MIDVRSREVRVFDRPVELSAKEYDLLVTLAGEPTRVFTRAELMHAIWGLRRRSGTPARSTATPPACGASCAGTAREAGDQRLGHRLASG